MKNIKKLETVGINVEVKGLGERRIFASIANFVGDWLATNQLFGMIEGFRGDFSCYFCYATREQMSIHFSELFFELRSRDPTNMIYKN